MGDLGHSEVNQDPSENKHVCFHLIAQPGEDFPQVLKEAVASVTFSLPVFTATAVILSLLLPCLFSQAAHDSCVGMLGFRVLDTHPAARTDQIQVQPTQSEHLMSAVERCVCV